MSKLTMLAAGAVGYVLGTRAGRERYDQIVTQAQKIKNDPRVRRKASEAQQAAKENAPVVKDKAAAAAESAKSTVQEKTGSGSSSTTDAGAGPVTGVDPSSSSPYPAS
jgi:hypothetical protein